jgi:hypothetical protein
MRKGDDFTAFIVPKVMKNPEALTFRIPRGLFRPVAGKLYLIVDRKACTGRGDESVDRPYNDDV